MIFFARCSCGRPLLRAFSTFAPDATSDAGIRPAADGDHHHRRVGRKSDRFGLHLLDGLGENFKGNIVHISSGALIACKRFPIL